MCVLRNTADHSRNHFWCGKAKNITYVCVCVYVGAERGRVVVRM